MRLALMVVVLLVAGCGASAPVVTPVVTASPEPTSTVAATTRPTPKPTTAPTPRPSQPEPSHPTLIAPDAGLSCMDADPIALGVLEARKAWECSGSHARIEWFGFRSMDLAGAGMDRLSAALEGDCAVPLQRTTWTVGGTPAGRIAACDDYGDLVFALDGVPAVARLTGLFSTDESLAWFAEHRPFPGSGAVAVARDPFKPAKAVTVSGGRTTGISKTFRLRGGAWNMDWTARGGDTGSCFGVAWLNTPDGSDASPVAEVFDLSADTRKVRSGSSSAVVEGGAYIVGTITTCAWTVRFVNTGP